MNWTLEVVCIPVADVDRAKEFYSKKVGFHVDYDSKIGDGIRSVQLTPRGSGCSIAVGTGIVDMEPGSMEGMQLVVRDLKAARAELAERGVDVSEIQVYDEKGELHPMREGDSLDNVGFVFFTDPDGNKWGVQQISSRR